MMKNETVTRDIIADSLRGLGITLVVTGHIIAMFCENKTFPESINLVSNYIYSFHMAFFFMIAGYVHGTKERFSHGESCTPYIRKLMISIYLPCMYFSLCYWFPKFIVSLHSSFAESNTISTASIADLLKIPLCGFNLYWFLCSLFFVKSLHMLFERYVSIRYIHSLFWVILFSVLFFMNEDDNVPMFFMQFRYGLYFHLGFMMKRYNIIIKNLSLGTALFLAGTVCFIAVRFYGMINIFTHTGNAIFISLAIFAVFYSLNIKNRYLVIFGEYSMVIYCLHEYIIVVSKIIYTMSGLTSTVSKILLFVICTLCSMLIPLMIVYLYKNVKGFRWIEYIFYPGKYKRSPLPK